MYSLSSHSLIAQELFEDDREAADIGIQEWRPERALNEKKLASGIIAVKVSIATLTCMDDH